jgi:cytochrome c-type biogenesis protein CcmF
VWTALLAILTFALSLIGTFLVRSGILTSVHAFAVDPARGVFILAILGVAIGGALTLFALRAPSLVSDARFGPVSRESAILLNNALLATACATVFIGTFYPLFVDILSGERISVGAPFFNATFLPLMALLFIALAPGARLAWKKGDLKGALAQLWPAAGAGFVLATLAAVLAFPKSTTAAAGAGLAAWVFVATVSDVAARVKPFRAGARARFFSLPRSSHGMAIAHMGLAVVAIGVLGAGAWRSESVRLLAKGETIGIGGYEARLVDVVEAKGPNYVAERALFTVEKDGRRLRDLAAERRFYPVRGMQTTEAAIWTTAAGDVYLTLGERTGAGWAVRAFRHPLVLWLWIGAGLLALGGTVAASEFIRTPKRRAAPKGKTAEATA